MIRLNAISTLFESWRSRKHRNVTLTQDQMHDYQVMAVDFILDNPFCALFIDLGLGKTIISLTALREITLLDPDIKKVLVIAPLKVANRTWPDEVQNWDHTCTLEYSVITGDEQARKRAMHSSAELHIINRENVEWLVQQWRAKWPYQMVIIDESSSFKDHTTKRFKALANVRRYIKRLVELTATPAAESYVHLFAQIYLLDEGKRFGKHITHYKERYFTENKYSRKLDLRPGAKEVITRKIHDICMVMKAQDYLDMKEPVHIEVPVVLSDKEMARYKTMEEDYLIEVVDDLDGETIIEAETAAILAGKLLQMASGFIYDSRKELGPNGNVKAVRTAHHLHDHKMDALEALVENLQEQGENIMIVYHFIPSLTRLQKRFPKGVVMDKAGDAVTPWNKGKIPILFVHAQSAGHGLNLQKGGRAMIFFDIPWSLELYLQVIGRINRQGQERQVLLYHLVAKGTADQKVVLRLKEKRDTQDWLLRRITYLRRKRQKRLRELAEAL